VLTHNAITGLHRGRTQGIAPTISMHSSAFIANSEDHFAHFPDCEMRYSYAILSAMSKISLSIYRLPTPRAARIGAAKMVIDRNQQVYLAGSRVEGTAPSGEFLIVTLANGQACYVKTDEYEQARVNSARKPKK